MKKTNFLTMAAVALTMGFMSCSNDDVINENTLLKGEPTSMQLAISAPKTPVTYASADANASENEVAFVSAKVLIYEKTAMGYILEQVTEALTTNDFELKDNVYQLKNESKISTTTGEKKIYVAMNYTGSLPVVGSPIGEIDGLFFTLSNTNDLSNNTSGFAMFSIRATDANLVAESSAEYDTENKASVTVKRLVAKISVQEGTNLSSSNVIESQNGWIKDLKFTLGNVNKTSYLFQNIVGTTPNLVVQDKNWSSFNTTDFFGINANSYKSVDASDATIASGINPVYAPENTAEIYDVDGKNLTYVSIRAKYVPEFFCDETGTMKGNENTSSTDPCTFWTITNTDGKLYYFDVEQDAEDFKDFLATNNISVTINKYDEGYCYWRGYLNMNGSADLSITGSKAAKFDILRNVYYKAVIKKIKAPGFPSDQGKVTESTSLLMDVEIAPWTTHEDNWEL